MSSVRGLSTLTVCLCVQLSVCPLGSSDSATSSLWGKKLHFKDHRCQWQLRPETEVPALTELTVCTLLRIHLRTKKWTAFVYKAPGNSRIELGLEGGGEDPEAVLFGVKYPLKRQLRMNEWHSICITWSDRDLELKVYINGTKEYAAEASLAKQLAQKGTLTLGESHFINADGVLEQEGGSGLYGEIGLFRMWAREWRAEELSRQSCADGDVLSWDVKQWKDDCPIVSDNDIHCEWPRYKINMWTALNCAMPANCSVSQEEITRKWLESIFPHNISVQDIHVPPSSHACHGVYNAAVQQTQASNALKNSSCNTSFSCEAYVNVDPAANVEAIQTKIAGLLNSSFSNDFLILTSDPESISILPVELFSATTALPTAASAAITKGSTQSLPARLTSMSRTGEPLDLNRTAVGTDTFFRVNMKLNVSGNPDNPRKFIETWVKERLEVNDTVAVHNFIIESIHRNAEQNSRLTISPGKQTQYNCAFHAQKCDINGVADMKALIKDALTPKYENGSVIIQTMDLIITHIEPKNCLEDTILFEFGVYTWPETFPEEIQQLSCIKPKSGIAYRPCKLNISTDSTSWSYPDMRMCDKIVKIQDLSNITVTDDNAADVLDTIKDLVAVQLGNRSELSPLELDTVVDKLHDVVDTITVTHAYVSSIVNIFADILLSTTDIAQVANVFLNMTEQMGNSMDFNNRSVSVTAPSLALSMINVDPDEFSGLTFGVSCNNLTQSPRVFINQSFFSEPLPDTDASISLPSEIHSYLLPGARNTTRVQFHFYGTEKLFQDLLKNNATNKRWVLHPYIVSACINNSHVRNLKNPVVVTFRHEQAEHPQDKMKCMFWNFLRNDLNGGWDDAGCETRNLSPRQTSCHCYHLTHFAVLLDMSKDPISETDSLTLMVISYIGCGVSSLFLGITLLTYIAFEKLRRDYPSKILINLSAALLGLSMLFLLNSWLASFSNDYLCIATAAALHYFVLAAFSWMGLEAVHMYLALVKVFNIYIPSYILKFCVIGWGVPLVVVSMVLVIDKDAYGSILPEDASVALQSDGQFCWLRNNIILYVTVVAFITLILLANICVFIVVLIQIRQMRANKPSASSRSSLQDLRAVAGLTVLLGLTWAIAFFSFGPARLVLMYIFTIFNSLQGFFVFLFHCLMKENVRKQWRIHLCCGRFRLSDYSDWSRTVTLGGRRKKNNLVNSDSVASDSMATVRKVSASSTGSVPQDPFPYHKRA